MADALIKAENVSKKFCSDLKTSLWYGMKDIGRELTGRNGADREMLRDKEFWAVRNISFEVKRGECLGLIGRNGAGKSTMLRMLNGLIKPDKGRIEMHGRVGALIELGAGFNPILTGRENIYNNASILGFSRNETHKKLTGIIEFSELNEFIDTPVQYYSSGMRLRLGFAIAAQFEPDILLIDEILAVGDIGFTLKCFNRIDELFSGTAIVFVSHNMPQVSRICTGLIVLSKGQPVYQSADVSQGISQFYDLFDEIPGNFTGSDVAGLENIYLTSSGRDSRSDSSFEIKHGEELNVHLEIRIKEPLIRPAISLMFYDKELRNFGEVFNFNDFISIDQAEGRYIFVAHFKEILMGQGVFSITVGLTGHTGGVRKSIFRMQSAVYFRMTSARHGWAPMQFTPVWSQTMDETVRNEQ